MKRISTTVSLILLSLYSALPQITSINGNWGKNIEMVLHQAGKNRPELEKALIHFQKSKDTLKYKAICFLIENMDIHYSNDYYWADSLNKAVNFKETNYSSFEESLKAFEILKRRIPGIHPVPIKYRDIDSIKADFLIDNVERAFKVWQKPLTRNLTFPLFCEYILPYRVFSEPLQNWRGTYQDRFAWVYDSVGNKGSMYAVKILNDNIRKWFVITWSSGKTNEPITILGPLQSLHRKQGLCQSSVCLGVYAMRSLGLPCVMEIVPYWATTANSHYFNGTLDEKFNPAGFEAADRNPDIFKLQREPSKVLQITYAKQPGVLASMIPEEQIPDGILQNRNIKDVTSSYWPVKDVDCDLFSGKATPKVCYACVLNGGYWKPAWWGIIINNKVKFKEMAKGVVYLPMFYIKGKLIPAGHPVASGYNHEMVLSPDTLKKGTVKLKEQDKYLIYRENKVYRLYFWNNRWKFIGEKTAQIGVKELEFENVPRNALLKLVPEYSTSMERPFIITNEGERVWW